MTGAEPNRPRLLAASWSGVVAVAAKWTQSDGGNAKLYAGKVMRRRIDALEQMVAVLRRLAESAGVLVRLSGRVKSFDSTWHKMATRKIAYGEVFDLVGVRAIVERADDCYQLLERVHRQYAGIPGHERDYIGTPKENGYQSLHTTVRNKEGMSIEVQLRTSSMHERSESGPASHQAYKATARFNEVARGQSTNFESNLT